LASNSGVSDSRCTFVVSGLFSKLVANVPSLGNAILLEISFRNYS
jgi:hypothetical protein